MNNSPQNKSRITVDGVSYDLSSGQAKSLDSRPIRPNTDIVRTAPRRTTTDVSGPQQPQQRPIGVIELPQKRKFISRRTRKKIPSKTNTRAKTKIASLKHTSQSTGHSFGWFLAKALLPSGFSASAWAFSVLRGITSPQAWLLAALPIIILELQNVVFENVNELLSKAHMATQNGQVFHATPAIIGFVGLMIAVLFVRVLFNAIAMHLRTTLLAGHRAKLWPATKLAIHNSLKILVHGTIQLILIGFACVLALLAGYWLIFAHHGDTFRVLMPYLVGLLIFIWVIIICLLHAKHWLQTAILSSALQTTKAQRRSLEAISTFPLRSALLALLSFSLTVGVWVYGIWAALKTIEWLSRSAVPSNNRFILLVSSIFLLVVLAGYLQQTIWSSYASWVNTQYTPKLFVMATDRESNNSSTWQIWVSVYLVIMAIAFICLSVVFVLPIINNHLVNFASHLPDKLDIPRINK